jgi:tetratricopeptide (TPR) repeat protein
VEHALRLDRSRADLWRRKGELLAEMGRVGPARGAFEEALRLDSGDRTARLGLAQLLVESGADLERGAALAESTLTRTAADVTALVIMGRADQKAGRVQEARTRFQAALAHDPVSQEAIFARSNLELAEGRTALALKGFRRVAELDPSHAKSWIAQGLIYSRFGERRRALTAYGRAFHALGRKGATAKEVLARMRELDPYADPRDYRLPDPPLVAARTKPAPRVPKRDRIDPRYAAEAPPAVAPARPGSDIDLSAPEAAGRPGARPSAQARAEGADLPGRLERMAELYAREGLHQDAGSAYHALIARAPASEEARHAQVRIRELERLGRPDPDRRVAGLRRLASQLQRRGDRRGARECLERVLLVQPGDPAALKDLAFLAARAGDYAESLELAGRALTSSPGYAEALLVQGYALARQRKFQQALVVYRAVLEADPEPQAREYAARMARALEIFADGPTMAAATPEP